MGTAGSVTLTWLTELRRHRGMEVSATLRILLPVRGRSRSTSNIPSNRGNSNHQQGRPENRPPFFCTGAKVPENAESKVSAQTAGRVGGGGHSGGGGVAGGSRGAVCRGGRGDARDARGGDGGSLDCRRRTTHAELLHATS